MAFELMLAEAPMTTPVAADDAEDQEIDVTGTVTVTDMDEDLDPVTYIIAGEVTYKPATITTTKANQ